MLGALGCVTPELLAKNGVTFGEPVWWGLRLGISVPFHAACAIIRIWSEPLISRIPPRVCIKGPQWQCTGNWHGHEQGKRAEPSAGGRLVRRSSPVMGSTTWATPPSSTPSPSSPSLPLRRDVLSPCFALASSRDWHVARSSWPAALRCVPWHVACLGQIVGQPTRTDLHRCCLAI